MSEYKIPVNQCIAHAKRRISDAAWALECGMREGAETSADLERQAREFLAMAASQGWAGDADALVAEQWAIYRTPARRA
jgi:hypothetical protein